jgi:hypothetical protein
MHFSPKTLIRTAVIGLTLAGATLSAVPAQAQQFSFGFHIGNGGYHNGPVVHDRSCLSDRQVRRLLQRNGYDEIRFTDRRGRIVQVRAERGRHDYRVTVDACRGRIIDVDRLRRR